MELKYFNFRKALRDLLLDPVVRSRWLKHRSIQWALSECFNNQRYVVIGLDELNAPLTISYKNCQFFLQPIGYSSIFTAYQDYEVGILRPSDKVLDLGACIGGFALPAARKCREVIAVEPLFLDLLQRNIELNQLKNIVPIEYCIGPIAKFGRERKICDPIDFKSLLSQWGPFNCIKIDIEGGEEYIEPQDLTGAEVITGEFHIYGRKKMKLLWKKWEELFLSSGYYIFKKGRNSKEEFRFTIQRRS